MFGGGEVREVASEGGAEVGFFAEFGAEERVAEADSGGRMNDSEAATPAGGGLMLATSGVIDRTGFNGGFRHDFPLRVEVWRGTPPPIVLRRVRKAKKTNKLQEISEDPECGKSPEANEKIEVMWRGFWLDREIAGRQTSANAGRATDFTRKCITRKGGLSILKCNGYSIRMSWQVF